MTRPVLIPDNWRYYITLYRGSYRVIGISLITSIGQSITLVPLVFLARYLFDSIIPSADSGQLIKVSLVILLLYMSNGALALYNRYISLKITKQVIKRLRVELLERCYLLSQSFYGHADLSVLHASIVQDTERLDVMSNALVSQVIPSLVISATIALYLALLNPILFLVVFLLLPVQFLVGRRVGRVVHQRVMAFLDAFAQFSKGILFVLQAMSLTRSQAAEAYEIERQQATIENLRLTSGLMAWLDSAYSQLQSLMLGGILVLILIIGGGLVAAGSMSLGGLLSFYIAFSLLGASLGNITGLTTIFIVGNQALRTLYDLFHIGDTLPYAGQQPLDFQGNIELKSVHFRFDPSGGFLLQDVNLTIQAGQSVAITGPNGGGKSTIINLILGFYRPEAGMVYADGCPLGDLDLIMMRRDIGIVMQDPIIFPGTVAENIAYGYPTMMQAQIIHAAELASAEEFIAELPQKYETFVGEGGMLLSGGQRQRIALARALARRPSLLILDEPTNHLDADNVRKLIALLKNLDHKPSILIVSHMLDVIREVDRAYILRDRTLQPFIDSPRP